MIQSFSRLLSRKPVTIPINTYRLIFCCCLLFSLALINSAADVHAAMPGSSLFKGTSQSVTASEQEIPPEPAPEPFAQAVQAGTVDPEQASNHNQNKIARIQLILEDLSTRVYWRLVILNINSGRLTYDVREAAETLAGLSHFSSFGWMLLYLLLVFGAALGIELLCRVVLLRRYLKKVPDTPQKWTQRLLQAIARSVPEFISLGIYLAAAYGAYILLYSSYFSVMCPAFLSVLVSIIVIRSFHILAGMLLSPSNPSERLITCEDSTARVGQRSSTAFIAVITVGVMVVSLLKYGGLSGDSLLLVKLFFGTFFMVLAGIVLYLNRGKISRLFSTEGSISSDGSEAVNPSPNTWLIPAFCYLILVWSIWCSKLIFSEIQHTLAFFMSLIIIPVFLILDSLVGWLFSLAARTISGQDELLAGADEHAIIEEKPSLFYHYLRVASRVCLFGLLLLWVLYLWDIRFSYTPVLVAGIERVTLITVFFFIFWQIIDSSISAYLSKKEEAQEDQDDSGDSEWGGGVLLDRGQTLLPIVRKFLGIVILVLLVLFSLSSLGVNIGPLLAGAGVMGIAIGFGAQKLVSDLMSGFFFLVDDAFRVGEYIEGGTVKGTVEKITLRNLMLRHHRGMLQIVPHSDLGSITNYMRGGIVVKFNLQFPYDTDVDMVRKVIKRVGIAMLDDPELGPGFIKQLKSQGIREVGDSVLTIRAKFTAKPGTHFLIQREAYRRVTEALNAKGIYYAHRKVIVDIPESKQADVNDEATKNKLLQAGAASTLGNQGNGSQGTST